jgi:hypothetical protein
LLRAIGRHGIDFIQAQELWFDLDRVAVPAKTVDENRSKTLASRYHIQRREGKADFPVWMIESLDREARRRGVTRQSIIKMWLADKLKESSNRNTRGER